jgi:hypothetical protein
MKRVFMIYTREMAKSFKDGKWTYETLISEVRVMAIAEGYAMVRAKGGMPFVVNEKNLSHIDKELAGK